MRIEVEGASAAEVERVAGSLLEKSVVHSRQVPIVQIDLSNSTIGVLNAGQVNSVESIAAGLVVLSGAGFEAIATALKAVTEAVAKTSDVRPEERTILLKYLEELTAQAQTPPEKRQSGNALAVLLVRIGAALGTTASLAQVWSTWGTAIRGFFGV